MTCTNTTTLGAYLLGALEPGERFEFEAHLAGCDACRTELVRLAPLPGMLNQITLADFESTVAPDLPPTVFDVTQPMPGIPVSDGPVVPVPEVLSPPAPASEPAPQRPLEPAARVTPLRRRSLRVAAAAVVVLLITIGGVFGWRALHETQPPAAGVTWSATAGSGASADARLIDHEWGTEIQVKMRKMPPGRECYLVVYDHYGHRQIAGWWGTDHGADDTIPASTSIRRSKIDRLEFLLDDRSLALTIPAQ